MSNSDRVINVGASARASDVQAIADVAALADDRALEILFTPGAALKRVAPITEESASFIPRLLVAGQDTDGTIANGKVRLRPCWLEAGADASTIALSAKLKTNLDSAVFGNNSSGSTRYDLVYVSVNYGTPTQVSVRQKPTPGNAPVSALLTVQNDILVTIGIVPGVSNVTPLASLPADSGSGKAGTYNFGLALVALPNGYAGGAVNQSIITQLWSGALISTARVRGARPASIAYGAAAEKAASFMNAGTAGAERWSSGAQQFFAHFKILPGTSPSLIDIRSTGVLVDNSIDWRNRIIYGFYAMIGSGAQAPIEACGVPLAMLTVQTKTGTNPQGVYNYGVIPPLWTGPGINNASLINLPYADGIPNTYNQLLGVDTNGVLRAMKQSTPQDNTNGDLFVVVLYVSDKMLANS